MPSSYLAPADYATYGLPASTTAAQVTQASVQLDAYLKRSEGLVWTADGAGNPGWMAALNPQFTLNTADPITAGTDVVVNLTGAVGSISVGEALVLDRAASGNISEVVVVRSIVGTSVTLAQVVNNHPGPCVLESGLAIKQHRFMPSGRPLTNLAYTPVARLLSGQGRYGYERRGKASRYMVDEFNLLASLSHFGGPPAWEAFPLENTGVDSITGQVWVPAGVMLAYYSEVNIWYVAGFNSDNIPGVIKLAVAQLVTAMVNNPGLGGVRSYKAGDTQIVNFANSIFTDDMKADLALYRAKLFN